MRDRDPRFPLQNPYKRIYPSGRVAWVARYYDRAGKALYAKPKWNRGKSSFRLKRDAQRAIDEALLEIHGPLRGAPFWRSD